MTSEMGFFFFLLVFRWLDKISCSEIEVTDAKFTPNIILLMIAGLKLHCEKAGDKTKPSSLQAPSLSGKQQGDSKAF